MEIRKTAQRIAVGMIISMAIHHVIFGGLLGAIAQPAETPNCLSTQPHATSGGSEKLMHRYEGVDRDYWLYYTYGAADADQQYAMELILVTTEDSCSVEYWNAPGHTFAYSDVVPMDVARQFSLSGLQDHLDTVGRESFESYYASIDPDTLYEEDLWALEQMNVELPESN